MGLGTLDGRHKEEKPQKNNWAPKKRANPSSVEGIVT